MFLLFLAILFVTAAGLSAFLLVITGDDLRRSKKKSLERKEPPVLIVTAEGDLINSKEDLEVELQVLNHKLNEKQKAIKESKGKIISTVDNINKILRTKTEVQKYYAELKYEIDKAEKECAEIKARIDDYSQKNDLLKSEMMQNEEVCQKYLDMIVAKKKAGSLDRFLEEQGDFSHDWSQDSSPERSTIASTIESFTVDTVTDKPLKSD